jgi:hypothetical protein
MEHVLVVKWLGCVDGKVRRSQEIEEIRRSQGMEEVDRALTV